MCIADNCFCAALLKGLQGRGLPIPLNVGMHRDPATRQQAMRVFFRNLVTDALGGTDDRDLKDMLGGLLRSLEDGEIVNEEFAVFALEMLGDGLTIIHQRGY